MGSKKATEQKTVATPELSPQMKGILYGNGQPRPNQNMQGMQLAQAPPMVPAAFPPGQAPMGFPSPPTPNPQAVQAMAEAFKGQNTGHHTGAISGMAKGAMGPSGHKGAKGK